MSNSKSTTEQKCRCKEMAKFGKCFCKKQPIKCGTCKRKDCSTNVEPIDKEEFPHVAKEMIDMVVHAKGLTKKELIAKRRKQKEKVYKEGTLGSFFWNKEGCSHCRAQHIQNCTCPDDAPWKQKEEMMTNCCPEGGIKWAVKDYERDYYTKSEIDERMKDLLCDLDQIFGAIKNHEDAKEDGWDMGWYWSFSDLRKKFL